MTQFDISVLVDDEDADEFEFAFEQWFKDNGLSFLIQRKETKVEELA